MFSLIPMPWKLGALALVLALCSASSYVMGRKHVRQAWDAANAVQAAEMARLKGQQEERERMWSEAMKTAGAKYEERARVADSNFNAGLDGLRRAYASRDRMQPAAPGSCVCESPGGIRAADLLGTAEALAAAIRDADKDLAAVKAANEGWPR